MNSPCNELPRAAGVALVCGHLVLLAKRIVSYKGSRVAFGGYWSLFTGVMEEGESPEECARRELWEEAQLSPQGNVVFVKTLRNKHCSLAVYGTSFPQLVTPLLNYEHTEYGWFDIRSLGNFPEKIDRGIVECIQEYYEITLLRSPSSGPDDP